MAKVIVTGGAGFIGSHIVDLLLARGDEVVVVDNLSSGFKSNLPSECRLIETDIRDPALCEILRNEKPDTIVHAAAQISVRVSMEDPGLDTAVNVGGLVNILQSFPKDELPYFVFLSTGGAIYGEQEEFPAAESHLIQPSSIYGLAKRVSEMYLDFWARELGLKYAALRLGNVYGPRQSPHGEAGVIAIFCKMLLDGKVPVINGSGEQTRDFVYVSDVASAAGKVSEQQITGIFNIGTSRETSVNALYAEICRALGLDVKPEYADAKAGEQMRSCIDWQLAHKTFNWEPSVSIDAGIKTTAEWFRDTGPGKP